MLYILNKILLNQLDPEVVNGKLDEILKGVSDIRQSVNKLQEKDAPWVLSDDQKQKLVAALKNSGKIYTVPIWYSPNDPRSNEFAKEVSAAIDLAGWTAKPVIHILMQDAAGVFIGVRDATKPAPEAALILQRALETASISSNGESREDLKDGEFELYIGQKPTGEPTSVK